MRMTLLDELELALLDSAEFLHKMSLGQAVGVKDGRAILVRTKEEIPLPMFQAMLTIGFVDPVESTWLTPPGRQDYLLTNGGRARIGLPQMWLAADFANEHGYSDEHIRRLRRAGKIRARKVAGVFIYGEGGRLDKLFSASSAAKYLGVAEITLKRWLQKRLLVGTRIGDRFGRGTYVFEQRQLDAARPCLVKGGKNDVGVSAGVVVGG